MRRAVLLVGALFLMTAVAPSASGMVIQGHSPIVLLVTDPNGNQFGCTAASCNSTMNFVDTLPLSECMVGNSTVDRCSYQFPDNKTEVATITIPNAGPGNWMVTYFGTGAPGASFTITVQSCPPSGPQGGKLDNNSSCQNDCNGDNGDSPSTSTSTSCTSNGGQLTIPGTLTACAFTTAGCPVGFNLSTDGVLTLSPPQSTSVPQFPAGYLLLIPLTLACLLLMRARLRGTAAKAQARRHTVRRGQLPARG